MIDHTLALQHYREQLRLAQRDAAIREAERALADALLNRDPDYQPWVEGTWNEAEGAK